MAYNTIVEDGIDILVVGAGLGGTGAAWEARFWGQDKKIVIAEKANIDRSERVKALKRLVDYGKSKIAQRAKDHGKHDPSKESE